MTPTRPQIEDAAARLAGRVRRTPVIEIEAAGRPVVFKLELLQHTGSFKPRGAFNRLLSATAAGGEAGEVVAASGGNHGAAVAFAARALGLSATIFVPEPTPQAKLDRIASYGARLLRQGADYAAALAASRAHAAATGALEVHAYDQPEVVAGQGTVALELEAQAPELTHVLVATGGGGLIGGIAGWYGGRVRVVSVEPRSCPTLAAALAAGRPVAVATGGLAADSLGARQLGDLAFALARAQAIEAVLVEDAAIAGAQAWLWEALRLVAEPGGAAALAALLSGAWTPPPGARVGVVLCGGNTAKLP